MVNILEQYNKGRLEIERPFIGLPYALALLAKSLIALANPQTGIVNDISHNELAILLKVNPAPGRKNSGTPSKQTIRNYIKSIERECGDYFKVISEGHSLQFIFPELPKILSELCKNTEVNTEVNLSETVAHTEQNNLLGKQNYTEVNIELNTASEPVKNIIFNNINNNNNNNKQSISENFTPNTETLARAEALGYSNASDFSEIQAFIDYNKATGSQFVDFNPIYLRWLAKSVERQQQKQLGTTGSIHHAKQYSLRTQTHQPSLRERVLKAHASDFALCGEDTEYFESSQQNNWNYGAFVVEVN